MASSDSSLRFRYREVSRVPLLNFPNTRSSYAPPRFHRPSRFDGILSASQRLNCWPRGTLVTRLYERGSFALSLIRSSGETRAHRSPSARPAFLTVRRLLYSNDSFHSFSSAEFCSAYLTRLGTRSEIRIDERFPRDNAVRRDIRRRERKRRSVVRL